MSPKLWPSLAFWAVLAGLSSSAEEEPSRDRAKVPVVVKTLDTGLRHWKEKAEFVANYRFTQAAALTFQDGVDGRFVDEFADRTISGKGVVAKTAEGFRFSLILDGRIKVRQRGKMISTNLSSFDVVVANGIQARYTPRQLCTDGLFLVGGVVFQRAGPELQDRFPTVNSTVPNPIFVCGGDKNHPFLSIVPRPIYKETVSWNVDKPSPGLIRITVTREGVDPSSGGNWEEVSDYLVRIDQGYPFIEQQEWTYFLEERLVARSHTVATGLVQAGKSCQVPSRIVSGQEIAGSSLRPRVPYDFWWITIWESADIGRRQPEDNDFVLTVADKTRVKGLQEKWRNATRFDLFEMGVSDLAEPGTAQARSATVAVSARDAGRASPDLSFMSARVICVALIVVGGGILSYTSRWRRTSRRNR